MKLILVHHADAVGPHVDPQRPLSTPGLAAAAALAERARLAGLAPAAIWHSGKLRARQTAEPFLRLNPFAEFKMVRGVSPDDPPELILTTLRHEDRDLLIVSHMPFLPALLQMLTGDRGGFPLHGLVELERTETGAWAERGRIL